MAEKKTNSSANAVKKLQNAISKIEKKTFKVMFFVVDSKGAPMGLLSYMYHLAYHLKELGYKVQMLHAEKDFCGVESWLGKKYSSLPHFNIEKDNVDISPCDFLIIPEIYSNVMSQTKSLPCKRIALLHNFNYLTDTIPMGISWDDLQIRDCIVTTENLKKRIVEAFPDVNASVISPAITEDFRKEDGKKKKLLINVIAKNQGDINAILKPFYWKYPIYSWIAFRPVNNLPKEEFADALREGIATIWCDPFTDFGYSALEAMSCGNIVIGKIPENESDWIMNKEGSLKDNALWFYNVKDAPDLIAGVINSFLYNSVPDKIYDEMKDTVEQYTVERQNNEIEKVFGEAFERRKKELETALEIFNKKTEKE